MSKDRTPIKLKCVQASIFIYTSCLMVSVSHGQLSAHRQEEITTAGENKVRKTYQDLKVADFITGKVYNLRYTGIEGSQFLIGDYFVEGTLEYDGVLFEKIPLQYDVYEQLIITLFDSGTTTENISIDNDKIAWLSFEGLKFINYKDELLPHGIYQEFHSGIRSKLLIKRIKEKTSNSELSKYYNKFNSIDKIYLLLENEVYKIGNKKDLMNALNNDKNVKMYIKSNHLRFNNAMLETSLGRVLKYFDEL